jgi:predicted GNAT family acetyltransferase
MEAATADLEMDGWRFGSAAALLAEGLAAGAVVDGRLVSVAFTSARTVRHSEVGVVTAAPWRDQGFSTATAALVCADIQNAGQFPVWSTSEDNVASRRVATKLGFVEVSRRVYVNPG